LEKHSHFFKKVADANSDLKVSNSKAKDYLEKHIKTISDIKAVTGHDFINGKQVVERSSLWTFVGSMPFSLVGRCKSDY